MRQNGVIKQPFKNEEKSEMKIKRIGVDIAKNVFHVHGVDRHGELLWRKKLRRNEWISAIREKAEPGTEIAMEACASSHHWARVLQSYGYEVKLIAAQFVKPFVKSNKNDRNDAEAISEAMSRPSMRFVAVKSIAQQDVQAMHRIRSELVSHRTAKANQIRGLIGEYGVVAPVGINQLRQAIPCWLEDAENGLSDLMRELLSDLWSDLIHFDKRIERLDNQIALSVKADPVAQKLSTLKGVGPLGCSALAAALGDGTAFKNGRQFAASLGLTPKQHSTGGKEKLLGISKRGDSYLRTLMVHGARTVIRHAKNKEDPLSHWISDMCERKHTNIVSIALANKTARIAWAMVTKDEEFNMSLAAARS
jgi:transposase